ncbi:uncharacterized protein BXZ73DRAFT_77155 [Epithele typhae]|uniref:uncharacterized protein n=1 Tax=Epithele typhae TaxID=378194 RepID=UPI002008DE4E|nr:uncharacterized protein BXZ73DRAFT_77155 [Epithele typhae]KAH9934065.1 hypothetical protein BXZ73DRAFT_77155 [Epithele typhae]
MPTSADIAGHVHAARAVDSYEMRRTSARTSSASPSSVSASRPSRAEPISVPPASSSVVALRFAHLLRLVRALMPPPASPPHHSRPRPRLPPPYRPPPRASPASSTSCALLRLHARLPAALLHPPHLRAAHFLVYNFRVYEEAMEQLQADLSALEQDKTLAANPERQASTTQVVEQEVVATEGNLETSYLLEQHCLFPAEQELVVRDGRLRVLLFRMTNHSRDRPTGSPVTAKDGEQRTNPLMGMHRAGADFNKVDIDEAGHIPQDVGVRADDAWDAGSDGFLDQILTFMAPKKGENLCEVVSVHPAGLQVAA